MTLGNQRRRRAFFRKLQVFNLQLSDNCSPSSLIFKSHSIFSPNTSRRLLLEFLRKAIYSVWECLKGPRKRALFTCASVCTSPFNHGEILQDFIGDFLKSWFPDAKIRLILRCWLLSIGFTYRSWKSNQESFALLYFEETLENKKLICATLSSSEGARSTVVHKVL